VNVVSLHAPRLVGDVMADRPIVVRVDAGLGEAAGLLERHAISGLPVVDDADALVGVISESDLLRARATGRADPARPSGGGRAAGAGRIPPRPADRSSRAA
jgi:CBS domain-containing protein